LACHWLGLLQGAVLWLCAEELSTACRTLVMHASQPTCHPHLHMLVDQSICRFP
jgi:hypothetical protein